MDFNLLNEIMTKDLYDLPVNRYSTKFQGTLAIANYYLSKKEGCRSQKASKYAIKMLYNDVVFGGIYGQSPTSNKLEAKIIAHDKIKTEEYLKQAELNTTESVFFSESEYDKAKLFVEKSEDNLVLKPLNLNGGRGISLNVTNDNFDFAWNIAKEACLERKKEIKIIIQKFINGVETRFLVIEGKFNSAILRVPANVIGDGKSTISELIIQKNTQKKNNPHLKVLPIKVDVRIEKNLQDQSLTLESVLENKQLIYLHNVSNISTGGDSYEISHLVNQHMIETAEKAVKAIPGLNTAGVDLIYNSLEDNSPYVLELNPDANLRMHHYPFKGEPKQPVFDLIDSMLSTYKIKNNLT